MGKRYERSIIDKKKEIRDITEQSMQFLDKATYCIKKSVIAANTDEPPEKIKGWFKLYKRYNERSDKLWSEQMRLSDELLEMLDEEVSEIWTELTMLFIQ